MHIRVSLLAIWLMLLNPGSGATQIHAGSKPQNKKSCRRITAHKKRPSFKKQHTISQPSATKLVPIRGYIGGYIGKLDTQKHSIEIDVGDIANTNNIVTYCQGVATQSFKQYPICKTSVVFWDVVAANQTVSGSFAFRRTVTGAERIK